MSGEHAEDVGQPPLEEIKRCMLEAMDRFRSKAEKRFKEICMLYKVFGFLNPHAFLQSENIEEDMNKLKNIYADDVNFSELTHEIARFNRLVPSSGTAFQSDVTALDLLQWLTKYRLCESTPYLFLCLKLYLTSYRMLWVQQFRPTGTGLSLSLLANLGMLELEIMSSVSKCQLCNLLSFSLQAHFVLGLSVATVRRILKFNLKFHS